ncbi:MAG: ATP-binding protein [Bryobacteraceae bacterium]
MSATAVEELERRNAELESEIARLRSLERDRKDANFHLLARGLAHDFNNLLGGILGHASLIEATADAGSEMQESAQVIREAAERAGELTQQLLDSAGGPRFARVDVHETVREVVRLVAPTFAAGQRVETNLAAPISTVSGDGSQLHQMLLNLVLNARQALGESGAVSIATSGGEGRLYLRVTDTGRGMTAELRRRIFDPLFTTRALQGGSGLGLAVVRRVVENHGGKIEVDSTPGTGTEFRVSLNLSFSES